MMGEIVHGDGAAHPAIFVIDDDASLREAIEALLLSVGHAVRTFSSAEDFVERRGEDVPGCLLLDIRLPGVSGLGLQRQLRAADDKTPTIFITAHADVPMSVQALKEGAVDFLLKPFRDQDLLDAVQAALAAGRAQRDITERMSGVIEKYRKLTAREREVLWFVVEGQVSKQIASFTNLSEVTVKFHRAKMMRKMGAESLAQLVRMADYLSRKGLA